MYSCSQQDEPFVHIDGDVFLWDKFDERVLHADIISQNLGLNLPFYKIIIDEIRESFPFIPEFISLNDLPSQNIFASNAGIISESFANADR